MVINIAHRGDSGNRPENTLAAFESANEIGADQIELDVQFSEDGELIVVHDAAVDRTTNGHGAVREMTLAELKALDAGAWFAGDYAGQRLPTLAEAVSIFPEWMGLNLNTNYFDPQCDEYERKIVQVLEQVGLLSRTVIAAYHLETIRRCRRAAPELECRILPGPECNIYNYIALCQEYNLRTMQPGRDMMIPEFVDTCHRYGLQLDLFYADTRGDMVKYIEMGVDGILTDYSARLKDVLATRAGS